MLSLVILIFDCAITINAIMTALINNKQYDESILLIKSCLNMNESSITADESLTVRSSIFYKKL